MRQFSRLFACIIVAAEVLSVPPAKADWTEDFAGADIHQLWDIYDDMSRRPPNATNFSFEANNLQLIADFQQMQDGIFDLFAAGIVSPGDPQYSFTDVKVQATVFAATGHNFGGAVARGNNDSFVLARMTAAGNSGYVFSLDFDTGDIDLVRAELAPAGIIGIANGTVPGFDPALSYILELTVEGTSLTGRVLRDGNQLASITADDEMFASGWSGVGGAVNDNIDPPELTTIAVGFDDVSSTTIRPPVNYDLTGDGRVTLDDVVAFVGYYGSPFATQLSGDFSGDGQVGLSDLALLKDQLSLAGSPSQVPEPGTLIPVLFAVSLLVLRRFTSSRRILAAS